MLSRLRSNKPHRFNTLAQNLNLSLENTVVAAYAGASMQLRPLFRIDTVRRVLFSGDALPMRALAAYNYV